MAQFPPRNAPSTHTADGWQPEDGGVDGVEATAERVDLVRRPVLRPGVSSPPGRLGDLDRHPSRGPLRGSSRQRLRPPVTEFDDVPDAAVAQFSGAADADPVPLDGAHEEPDV